MSIDLFFIEIVEMDELMYFESSRIFLISDLKTRLEPVVKESAYILSTVLDPRQMLNIFPSQGIFQLLLINVNFITIKTLYNMCINNIKPIKKF